MRLGETATHLLCVFSIALGAYLIYLGLEDDDISTSPLTASAIAYFAVGALGIVLVWRLGIIRENETASRVIAACVAVTIIAISCITCYVMALGFGAS